MFDYNCNTVNELKTHISINHDVKCLTCNKFFKTQENLNDHMKDNHNIQYICN